MTLATGIGSWPGTSVRDALAQVRELLDGQLPYLPELPEPWPGRRHDRSHRGPARRAARGPAADRLAARRPARARRLTHRRPCCARTSTSSPRPSTATPARSSSRSSGRGPSPRTCGSRAASASSSTRAPAVTSSSRSPRAYACTSRPSAASSPAPRSCCRWTNRACRPSWPAGSRRRRASGRLPSLDPQVAAAGLTTVLGAHGGDTVAALLCRRARRCRSCARPVRPRCRSTPRCSARASGRAWRSRWRTAYACTRALVPTDGSRTRPQDLADDLVEAWHRESACRSARSLDVVVTPACGLGRRVARRRARRAARRGRDRPRARGAQRRVTLRPVRHRARERPVTSR